MSIFLGGFGVAIGNSNFAWAEKYKMPTSDNCMKLLALFDLSTCKDSEHFHRGRCRDNIYANPTCMSISSSISVVLQLDWIFLEKCQTLFLAHFAHGFTKLRLSINLKICICCFLSIVIATSIAFISIRFSLGWNHGV